MALRGKVFIGLVLVSALLAMTGAARYPSHHWLRFAVYLAAILLSSGMKVSFPKGDSTMSVNFPFILLALVQLSLPQAMALGALSVIAQCNFHVQKIFTVVQIAFNVANSLSATAAAWLVYILLLRLHLSVAPSLSVAAIIYFIFSSVPVSLVIGLTSSQKIFPHWSENFLWCFPFYLVAAALAALGDFLSLHYGGPTSLLIIPVAYTIYWSYNAHVASVRASTQHLEEMEALHLRTIEGLAMAIEAKDQNTHDHLLRVRVYVSDIGKALQLSKSEMQAVLTAALLHDIGKLAVPEHIINKPGKLTQEEFEKMKIHPVVGADILERVRFPYPVVPIVRSHHEWWNGMGYPDGLSGEAIPIGARILTVVDCFDALASDRPYRRALPLPEAMAMVKKLAGTQFDPRVVDALENRYVELEELARRAGEKLKRLNTEIAVARGRAPGAGLEQAGGETEANPQAALTDASVPHTARPQTGDDALIAIAAASQQAQTLYELSRSPGFSLSLDEIAALMALRLHRLIPFACCVLYLKNGDELVPQGVIGVAARYFSSERIPIGAGISGWVAHNDKPIVNGNATVEPHYLPGSDDAHNLHSALSLPLHDMHQEVFGVLSLYAAGKDSFSRDHLRMLLAIETKFSLSLQDSMPIPSAEIQDPSDFLSSAPKIRSVFLDLEAELERCVQNGGMLMVVACDMNAIESVNELQGHLAGQLLLDSITVGFRRCCRAQDTVVHLGGNEFVFLMPGIDLEQAEPRLAAIRESAIAGCRSLQDRLPLSPRLGVAFYPADGRAAEELLARAEQRLHHHERQDDHHLNGVEAGLPAGLEIA